MYHSTETALVKIQADIMAAIDKGHSVAMIMLDLSSAFDTLDHSILLARLRNMYGIRGAALRWFHSYLSDRRQYVSINGVHSDTVHMDFGVPQGSVLGSILFSLYIKSLSEVITRHGLSYADDTQIYLVFQPDSVWSPNIIELCLADIKRWMTNNMLQLNANKTEVIYSNRTMPSSLPIKFGDSLMKPDISVKTSGSFLTLL